MLSGASMRLADSGEFFEAPLGRCVVGSSFVLWCAAPDLVGAIQWGTLDDQGVRDMVEILDFIGRRQPAGTGSALIDCTRVERVDSEALLGFATPARDRLPAWSTPAPRQVVVVPQGLPGLLVAGALPSLAAPRPLRFARELEVAFTLVDHPMAPAAHAAASEIAATARGGSSLLRRLRAELARDLADASIGRCATALRSSPRTLQRELARLSTTFSDELRLARVAAAEEMLHHSTMKIEAIAARVGLRTASRLSAVLRRERNASARELRARYAETINHRQIQQDCPV